MRSVSHKEPTPLCTAQNLADPEMQFSRKHSFRSAGKVLSPLGGVATRSAPLFVTGLFSAAKGCRRVRATATITHYFPPRKMNIWNENKLQKRGQLFLFKVPFLSRRVSAARVPALGSHFEVFVTTLSAAACIPNVAPPFRLIYFWFRDGKSGGATVRWRHPAS